MTRITWPDFARHQHCLNYLRQQALCHLDLTLEPGDFATRDFDVDRVWETHVCYDFEAVWDYNTERFLKDSRVRSESSSLSFLCGAPFFTALL